MTTVVLKTSALESEQEKTREKSEKGRGGSVVPGLGQRGHTAKQSSSQSTLGVVMCVSLELGACTLLRDSKA